MMPIRIDPGLLNRLGSTGARGCPEVLQHKNYSTAQSLAIHRRGFIVF